MLGLFRKHYRIVGWINPISKALDPVQLLARDPASLIARIYFGGLRQKTPNPYEKLQLSTKQFGKR